MPPPVVHRASRVRGVTIPDGFSRRWGWMKLLDVVELRDGAGAPIDLGVPCAALQLTTRRPPHRFVVLVFPERWYTDVVYDIGGWAVHEANRLWRAGVFRAHPEQRRVVRIWNDLTQQPPLAHSRPGV